MEPKAPCELIGWDSSQWLSMPASVNASVRSQFQTYIPEYYWGGGLFVLGFGSDRMRTLVSMATNSSHMVIMGKSCDHSSFFIYNWFVFILACNERNHKMSNGFEIQQDRTRDFGESCP